MLTAYHVSVGGTVNGRFPAGTPFMITTVPAGRWLSGRCPIRKAPAQDASGSKPALHRFNNAAEIWYFVRRFSASLNGQPLGWAEGMLIDLSRRGV
jgi:hypothetical protein